MLSNENINHMKIKHTKMFQHEISQSTVYQCNFIHILARHFQACSGVQTRFSLVPRPSKIGEGEGLVYTVCTCALIILSYNYVR